VLEQFSSEKVLNVGFELVPEITFRESQEIQAGETPCSRVNGIFSSRKAGIDDNSATHRGQDVGKRKVLATWCLQDESAYKRVFGALP
jgi:hypothetical protein